MTHSGMFSAKKYDKKRALLTALLAVSAALLFLMSSSSTIYALVNEWDKADTITGKIVAVDSSHATKILTLQSSELSLSAPDNEMNILVSGNTLVQMCGAAGSYKDLKPGSKMQVTYHEIAGLAVADFIDKPC